MIDIGFLTWTQQWEYWLFSRFLRPLEFGALFRWDFLLVPDQVWLLVGAYRTVRHLIGTPGSLWARLASLGGLIRSDPITFVAFGLLFVAEPLFRRRRNLRQEDVALEAMDVDGAIIAEEDLRLNEEFANEIENSQAGNQTVLPASVLNRCRNCRSDRVAATNLLVKCGHFPFCDPCVKKEGFCCNLCTSKGLKTQVEGAVGMTTPELAKAPTIVQLGNNITVNKSCGVCQEREGLLSLMPCGHLMFCGPCVLSFRMRCPFCRMRITRVVRGFDVRHQELAQNSKK
jgi:hypothetical protein